MQGLPAWLMRKALVATDGAIMLGDLMYTRLLLPANRNILLEISLGVPLGKIISLYTSMRIISSRPLPADSNDRYDSRDLGI
jgi:hypothetical protein